MFDFLPKYVETLGANTGVFYICQSGNSGYASASKGYIYDLIQKNIPVKINTYSFDDSNQNEITQFDNYIRSHNNTALKRFDKIVVHSTPNIWDVLIKQNCTFTDRSQIIGRTVWEFEKVPLQWVDFINNSMVHVVSVPTQWNKDIFEKNGVTKPIVVEPHIDVRFPYTKVDLTTLIRTKSDIIYNGDFSTIDLNSAYKLYTIGQFISRKGITETIDAYCKSFHKKDNVVLFVKTFGRDYSVEEQNECKRKIQNVVGNLSVPPIVFLKDVLTYDEIQSLHEQCDCYIQLTRTEGFGLGIFEAYNRNKKVIVTNYGGHTEYLPKSYEGLVGYEKIPVQDSVYYNFDLDSTYEWAKPSILHAKKLLSVISKSNKNVYASGDIFNLEYIGDNRFHRWFGKNFTFMFPNPVRRLVIYYSSINDKSSIQISGVKYDNLTGTGFVDTYFTEPIKEIGCISPTFLPSKLYNSDDCRELGIFIHSIKYVDINNDEFFSTIDELIILDETSKILCGYKNVKNNVYYHSGDLGDIIISLAVIKNTGGGDLYLGPTLKIPTERFGPRENITYKNYEFLKPLLESQPYIRNVIYTETYPENVTHDLNKFRTFYFKTHNEYESWPNGVNIDLLESTLSAFDLDLSVKNVEWLYVRPSKPSVKKIIINRTLRGTSQSSDIDAAYSYLVQNFSQDCGFIGLDDEYDYFVEKFGYIDRIKINDAKELADIIYQSRLYIGNSSFALWIAESFKKNIYFETPHSAVKHTKICRTGFEKLNILSVKEIILPNIYHVVPLYEPKHEDVRKRIETAKKSWDVLYESGNVIPLHIYENEYKRTTESLGDNRKCPFLLDLIRHGYDQCKSDDDIVMITNDDTILSPYVTSLIHDKIQKYDCCKSFRINLRSYEDYTNIGVNTILGKDGGRDMFAMTKRWIRHNIGLIPDYALGTSDWDLGLAILMQFTNGVWISKQKNDLSCFTDIDLGHVLHVYHDAKWRKLTTINHYNAQLTKNMISRLDADDRFPNMNHDRYETK